MKALLEWAVSELMNTQLLRNNQILIGMDHVGLHSVDLLLADQDRPDGGAVELLQVQVHPTAGPADESLSPVTCRVYTLMESAHGACKAESSR
ncbi:hypothetical protein [Larkinella soli]|uniref:hypothetical protein n=1 Tax=Larkinella soli TaxID=1770527 RepID=UPI000FFB7ED4|nr:hypothetical protein [Larkinella soli]